MKPGAGKGKGSAFERYVAKQLSLWLTRGQDPTQLVRSVLSGGWTAGADGHEPWRHAGDLAANGPIGEQFRRRVVIECKHRREIDLWHLWTRPQQAQGLSGWWRKLRQEAAAVGGLTPMLVVRGNRLPVTVGLPPAALQARANAAGWRTLAAQTVVVCEWLDLALFPLAELLAGSPAAFLD